MLIRFTRWASFCKTLVLALLLASTAVLPAAAQMAYGLASFSFSSGRPPNNLVSFDVTAPSTFINTVPITGLLANHELVGIDVRPATGALFALSYYINAAEAQLYTLNITTGTLTPVGVPQTMSLGFISTSPSHIGFDFDPTTDRLRVTSAFGTNYRLNPNTGALEATDGTLAYASTDVNASQTPQVGSSAFTNSYIGATTTTLYNVDEAYSRLVTQSPINAGTLNTVGSLGQATNGPVIAMDLDIFFDTNTGVNKAYFSQVLSGTVGLFSALHTVNLTTGTATQVGLLGSGVVNVWDIAVANARLAPSAITGQLAYALAGPNLLTFDTALPGTIRTSVGITGVEATQTLVGLDVRPANNALYALGYNAAAAAGVANSQLYTLNAGSGVATPLGAAFRLELGTGAIGFDFNPTVDRIRVVSANGNNYRLNPTLGAANVLAATDGTLSYNPTNNLPFIGTVAYTNSFSGSTPATTTTLYNYDININQLNIQSTANPPADGQLTAVGPSGIRVNNAAPAVDMDIYSSALGVNTAFLVANTGTSANTSLYTVNLVTGAATLVGPLGNGLAARNIAVAVASGVVTGTRPTDLARDLSLFPNPLAGTTSLSFGLPRAAHVELSVTDALGRVVDYLDAGQLPAGPQTLRWNRRGQGAGLYFFHLSFDGQPAGTRQAVLTE
jgi:hypothetical protein